MIRPEVDPEGRWVEYAMPGGETKRLPLVAGRSCPPAVHVDRALCVRCPHCGRVHRHGAGEGTRMAHCHEGHEHREYYIRPEGSIGPYLPWGWFENVDGPWLPS